MSRIDRHDWHSAEYVQDWIARSQADDERRLPRFRLMADLIPFPRNTAIAILDVGAGYGALTRVLLESFPEGRVVAQDYSAEMLQSAKKALSPFTERVSFHHSDLFSESWHDKAGGPFDAVVSSIAIHNLQSPPRIRQLYREINGLLNEGGCFLNVDLVNAPEPSLQRPYWELMRRQRRAPGEGTQEDRAAAWDESDWPPFPASLDEQLAWLREAGFRRVDCFWKELGTALVGGFK